MICNKEGIIIQPHRIRLLWCAIVVMDGHLFDTITKSKERVNGN